MDSSTRRMVRLSAGLSAQPRSRSHCSTTASKCNSATVATRGVSHLSARSNSCIATDPGPARPRLDRAAWRPGRGCSGRQSTHPSPGSPACRLQIVVSPTGRQRRPDLGREGSRRQPARPGRVGDGALGAGDRDPSTQEHPERPRMRQKQLFDAARFLDRERSPLTAHHHTPPASTAGRGSQPPGPQPRKNRELEDIASSSLAVRAMPLSRPTRLADGFGLKELPYPPGLAPEKEFTPEIGSPVPPKGIWPAILFRKARKSTSGPRLSPHTNQNGDATTCDSLHHSPSDNGAGPPSARAPISLGA